MNHKSIEFNGQFYVVEIGGRIMAMCSRNEDATTIINALDENATLKQAVEKLRGTLHSLMLQTLQHNESPAWCDAYKTFKETEGL
jgi:hypothetical protein